MSAAAEVAPRFVRDPAALWRRVADGVLVLPPAETEPFLIGGSGGALWDVLSSPVTIDEAAAILADAYGAPVADVRAGIAGVLDELAARGAIRSEP